jgi:hypothetical protein
MLSDIVGSGTRQRLRATVAGTMATNIATAQWVTDVTPSAIATRQTATTQAAKIDDFTFSEVRFSERMDQV